MIFPLPSPVIWRVFTLFLALTAGLFAPLTNALDSWSPDSSEHQSDLTLRIRYGLAKSGDVAGKTASAALQWQLTSDWTEQLSSVLELGHVTTAFDDDYNDGREMNDQPVIPDVASTELKQLALHWSDGVHGLTAGRQRIKLDDQRFIGSNNFWQNDQTLDAIHYQRAVMYSSTLSYAYVNRAHRIFATDGDRMGPSNQGVTTSQNNPYRLQLGQHDHNSHLLHLRLKDWDYQDISLFYYHMEIDQLPQLDNRTLGGRYQYERRWGKLKPGFTLSVADQSRSWSGESVHIPYYLVQLQLAAPSRAISLRHEVLGSRKGLSVATPLADLHAFHGWADAFNSQPGGGIRDTSVKLLWRHTPIKLDVRQHWFKRDRDGAFFGRETDLDVIVKISRQQNILLRLASFSASHAAHSDNIASEERLFLNYRLRF